MTKSDWIKLWILNELVCDSSPVGRLIHRPNDQSSAYWLFPSRAAFRASPEDRMDALLNCVKAGLIEIYANSWLKDRRFRPREPFAVGQCHFHDAQFVEQAVAVLTFPGHEKWEADFQPDWERFWLVENEWHDEGSQEVFLTVLYTGNQILDELLRWLPYYWGLDRDVGLTERNCHTVFQYAATEWKIIPIAKVISWKGLSSLVARNKLWQEPVPAGVSPDQAEAEWRAKVQHRAVVEREEYNQATRILRRLSKKWDDASGSDSRDPDVEPRIEQIPICWDVDGSSDRTRGKERESLVLSSNPDERSEAEQEWLACTDARPMLEFLRGRASDRKLRLFAVGCCRPIHHLMPDDRCLLAVDFAERFADGMATEQELQAAADAAFESSDDNSIATRCHSFSVGQGIYFAARTASYAAHPTAFEAAANASRTLHSAAVGAAGDPDTHMPDRQAAHDAVYQYEGELLHDIFGNPFRPVTVDPAWLTSNVVELASTIYDERSFDRMPELGDALEGAGCASADILAHCRKPGRHVRGCWVVDLLLGKE